MNLVIVESPTKSKTIEKYLGSDYKVVSSVGHIRDLGTTGKYGLGIDLENNFKPNYVPMKDKKKIIKELESLVKKADHVYLATDPDREGEAISWHLYDTLNIKDNYDRVLFYEITKDKVLEGLKNPRKIDYNLVKSQETRRMLDRIIGFRLSNLMKKKTDGTSAGRVQSVALKLIVEREEEIKAFVKEAYYTINADFVNFSSELYAYNNENIELKDKEEAYKILNILKKEFLVKNIESKNKSRASKYPFTTSTLQQEASTKLGFSAKKTMMIAQKLYEGIDLENETTGLITYMRTDSIRLSEEFVKNTFGYIQNEYGKEYLGYIKKSKKSENVQDAHEAIRPTNINLVPEKIKNYLSNDEFKLYKLIYIRTLASLMQDAKTKITTVIFDNNNYQFKTSGSVVTFDGYLKVYREYEDSADNELPDLTKYLNQEIKAEDIICNEHFTKPKPRYSEAKLIHELEELGIGRPSTYASIIGTIKDRGYVTLEDKKFVPTEIGYQITEKLGEYFSNIINVKYTANMEKDLDEIALGKVDNIKILKEFYDIFDKTLNEANEKMEKVPLKETGEMCPECGMPLVIRKSRYGEFVACSNYPTCKYIKKEEKESVDIEIVMNCPKCDGQIVAKKTRKGKIFYGCNHFPKCKVAVWDKPNGEICPKCQNLLIIKDDKIKCSNEKCDFVK